MISHPEPPPPVPRCTAFKHPDSKLLSPDPVSKFTQTRSSTHSDGQAFLTFSIKFTEVLEIVAGFVAPAGGEKVVVLIVFWLKKKKKKKKKKN